MDLSLLRGYRNHLKELDEVWQEIQYHKQLRIVVVEGDSGMHKTGLIDTFVRKHQIPSIRGYGAEVPESYLPLRLAFESLLKVDRVHEQLQLPYTEVASGWKITLNAFAQVLPLINRVNDSQWGTLNRWRSSELRATLGTDRLEAEDPSSPTTFPGLFTVALGELSAHWPFVFFIDNLHLSDPATLKALRFEIVPALQKIPILFVVALESQEETSSDLVSDLVRYVDDLMETRHLYLSPLDENAVETLLQTQLSDIYGLPDLVNEVSKASEGNLAQAQDIIQWLHRSDAVSNKKLLNVPHHTQLARQHFAQLSPLEQEILQYASVQGLYFCIEAVACALERDIEEVATSLNDASGISFFVHIDTKVNLENRRLHWGHFCGRNKRDLVYQSIGRRQQIEYHQKIALALEFLYSKDLVNVAGVLAQQFEFGEEHEKAAVYFAKTAERSNTQGAASQALRYAERGLRNLEMNRRVANSTKCELLIQKGRALQNTEQSHLALEILRESLRVSQSLQDSSLHLEAMRYLSDTLLSLNVWNEGMDLLTRAVKTAVRQKNWNIAVEGMEILRERYYKRGKAQGFLDLCDEIESALKRDRSSEGQATAAEILEDKGWLHYQRREFEKALAAFDGALRHLNSLPSTNSYPDIHYKVHRYRAEVFRFLRKYDQAMQECDSAVSWANATYNRGKQSWAHQTKATLLRDMGCIEQGQQEYRTALRLLNNSSDISTLARLESHYGLFLSGLGKKREAQEWYQRSRNHHLAMNNVYYIQMAENDLAAMDKHFGEFRSALAKYQKLLSEGLLQDDKHRQSLSLNHIGDIYRILNSTEKSIKCHLEAGAICEEIHRVDRKALALRRLGQTYLCSWRLSEAASVIKESLALHEMNISAPKSQQRTKIILARLLLCQGSYETSLRVLRETVRFMSGLQDEIWTSIALLNEGLVLLALSEPQSALSATMRALAILEHNEMWRDSEAHHLLARCYLALGDTDGAVKEIERAKERYLDLGLFHRVHQAESTKLHIEDYGGIKDADYRRGLSKDTRIDELRFVFNHLGV